MKARTTNSWIHIFMIAIIALMPLRVMAIGADYSVSTSSVSMHQTNSATLDHKNCTMDSSCVSDCQADTTHCSSASLVIPSYVQILSSLITHQKFVTYTDDLHSVSNRNLFRPPRSLA